MIQIPPQLLLRLDETERQLTPVIHMAAEVLSSTYALSQLDHNPKVGDNNQIFGLKIWHRLWFALRPRCTDFSRLEISDASNSHQLVLGRLRLQIHKLGERLSDDIGSCFPDASATQRAHGRRNDVQLQLFDAAAPESQPPAQAYALNDLTLAHFGNPDDGLLKYYLGAWRTDDRGIPVWVWHVREDVGAPASKPQATPFHQRDVPDVEVQPKPVAPQDERARRTRPA